jgi:hypothetical protein
MGCALANKVVVPAKAAIHGSTDGAADEWVPASAGMTRCFGKGNPANA